MIILGLLLIGRLLFLVLYMSASRCPQDMFSNTATQSQPIFAQWIQNTRASAPRQVPCVGRCDTSPFQSLTDDRSIYKCMYDIKSTAMAPCFSYSLKEGTFFIALDGEAHLDEMRKLGMVHDQTATQGVSK